MSFVSTFNSLSNRAWQPGGFDPWRYIQKFSPSNPASTFQQFGYSTSISNDGQYLAIGQTSQQLSPTGTGQVNVYTKNAGELSGYTYNTTITPTTTTLGTITATSSVDNTLTISSTASLDLYGGVIFSGTTFGNIVAGDVYYITEIVSLTKFKVGTLPQPGLIFTLTTFSGSMTMDSTFQRFGNGVALNDAGDVLAIVNTFGAANGYIHVYTRSGSTWTLAQLINAESAIVGVTLNIDDTGDYISILSREDLSLPARTVVVYKRSLGIWSLQQRITTTTYAGGEVSMSGNGEYICARATQSSVNVFNRVGTTWSLQQTISGTSPVSGTNFGTSNALNTAGDTLVIGNPNYGAEIFTRSGSTWTSFQTIPRTTGFWNFAGYGEAAAINSVGNIIFVGATGYDEDASNGGVVEVLQLDGGVYSSFALLTDPTPANEDRFGNPISTNGAGTVLAGTLLLGAPDYSGQVDIFEKA